MKNKVLNIIDWLIIISPVAYFFGDSSVVFTTIAFSLYLPAIFFHNNRFSEIIKHKKENSTHRIMGVFRYK